MSESIEDIIRRIVREELATAPVKPMSPLLPMTPEHYGTPRPNYCGCPPYAACGNVACPRRTAVGGGWGRVSSGGTSVGGGIG